MVGLGLITVSFAVILYQMGSRFRSLSAAARKAFHHQFVLRFSHSGHLKQYIPPISFSLDYETQVLPGYV